MWDIFQYSILWRQQRALLRDLVEAHAWIDSLHQNMIPYTEKIESLARPEEIKTLRETAGALETAANALVKAIVVVEEINERGFPRSGG